MPRTYRPRNVILIGAFLIMYFSRFTIAQAQSIRGAVVDSLTRKPLLEASVSLLSARDSSLVSFGITDGEGRFSFDRVAEEQYRVVVTYVGYRGKSRRVGVSSGSPNPDVGAIDLVQTTQTLGEVEVQGEKAPIAVKGDTLEFNAGSFKTRPNAQVEELLKKLPGVEVGRDGTVKAQGQEVKKVLVDGKPFFGNDPKMATRNLPADIIDKVQLYDQQSEQSQFSGVDDGDREKTINITTKRDKRKGTFGQQSVGVGPQPGEDVRYSARASVNRFNNRGDGPGRQMSVLGMANNINQQGFTAQDLGLGSNFGGAGQGRGGGPGGNMVRVGGSGSGNNNGQQVGNNAITQSWAAGLNYRDAWGKKVEVAGSYNASHTNTLNDQRSRRENVIPTGTTNGTGQADSAFVTNRQNGSDNTNTNHRFNLRLDYKIDSLTTLRVIPSLSWLSSTFQAQIQAQTLDGRGNPVNTSNTKYDSEGEGLSGSNSLLLFRKFRKARRTLSLNWNVALNNQNNDGINRSVNTFAQPNSPVSTTTGTGTTEPGSVTAPVGLFEQVINQRNEQRTRSMTNSLNVSYTEPLSMRQTLEFHYALSNNHNTSNRFVNDFNAETSQYDRPNARLSNQFLNTFLTNRAGMTWQTQRLKYTYALGFDAQQATLSSDNVTRDTSFSRAYTNLLPNALFTYNFARNRRLRIQYRTRINAPSVSQLQPVPDNTNPLNIRAGNANLQPEYSHNLSVNFNRFEPTTFRNLFASLNLSRTDNKIVNATAFTRSGAQTTQPVNTDGYYTANGFLVLGQPVKFGKQKANLNLTTNLTYNRGTSFVNSQPNLANNWLVGQGVSISSNFTEKLDLNLSGGINYQSARYSLQPQQNTTFLNQTITFDAFYQLPAGFTLSTDVFYNRYGGSSGTYNQSFTLCNATLAKQLFKQKQAELRFSAFDLLNQNQSITRNVTDTYTEEVQSRVLNRYFMVSFIYNLRNFVGSAPAMRPYDRPGRGDSNGIRGSRRNG